MSLVVIGGHSRNVGKTSVVAGLISALPERSWLAIKITQIGHGVCSVNGESCDCADDEHTWTISEERDRSGQSDTSRFLVAGARRSLWARCKQGYLAEAMPDLRREISTAADVILESNTVMRFLRPDLYLPVLDFATADFKDSAREYLDLASALIVHQPAPGSTPAWEGVSLKPASSRPVFYIRPPQYLTPEIVEFVRSRLAQPAQAR
jgi:hypothetical protein